MRGRAEISTILFVVTFTHALQTLNGDDKSISQDSTKANFSLNKLMTVFRCPYSISKLEMIQLQVSI